MYMGMCTLCVFYCCLAVMSEANFPILFNSINGSDSVIRCRHPFIHSVCRPVKPVCFMLIDILCADVLSL